MPKIGRKYVKQVDIMFYDTIEYDPSRLSEGLYKMNVTSHLPLLGDKVLHSGLLGQILGVWSSFICAHLSQPLLGIAGLVGPRSGNGGNSVLPESCLDHMSMVPS